MFDQFMKDIHEDNFTKQDNSRINKIIDITNNI